MAQEIIMSGVSSSGGGYQSLQTVNSAPVLVLVSLIVAAGLVMTSRGSTPAGGHTSFGRGQTYAEARVDSVFDLLSALPAASPQMPPVARKGDLLVPLPCMGMSHEARDECVNMAYKLG